MDTYKDHFLLVETFRKEEKYFKINNDFRKIIHPNFQSIARKFYAKHDTDHNIEVDDDILMEIKRKSMLGPKEKYSNPVTESQEVGWYSQPLVPVDRSNPILFHLWRESPITKFGVKLFKHN